VHIVDCGAFWQRQLCCSLHRPAATVKVLQLYPMCASSAHQCTPSCCAVQSVWLAPDNAGETDCCFLVLQVWAA
jgi:hypothetical protein